MLRNPIGPKMLQALPSIPLRSVRIAALAMCIALGLTTAAHAEEPNGATAGSTAETAGESQANDPAQPIEMFHTGLLEIMKQADALGIQGRIDKLEPLMAKTFDMDFMASKTVGRHWSKLSGPDKARWMKMFARFTTANYAGRFTGYTGERFETMGVEEAARNTRVVLTKIIVPDEDDVQLNYRLMKRDGEWRVIDVYLNGTVSELALRRSEYSSALKREGFEQLLASIETKIQDLKDKGQADG
ncbi:MAG: ABC transporter substrate-binding protein [Myxococcota bacterium]